MENSRRDFIKKVALSSAAITVGGSIMGLSAKQYKRIIGANDRVHLASIGVNSRGDGLAYNFSRQPNAEIIYICDVDKRAIAKTITTVTKQNKPAPKGENDFRKVLEDKSVDAVIIATPDHWHAPATILACKAGKHVYVEKPLSHNPREGELAIDATKKYKRIVQLGTQRRSFPTLTQGLTEMKNGAIGRVYFAKAWYTNKRVSIGTGKPAAVPEWLDYNLWQGPAPRQPYKDI